MSSLQHTLLSYFNVGVQTVVGDAAVARALAQAPLSSSAPVYLLAIGKAADAMVQGAVASLNNTPVQGLMITKQGHSTALVKELAWLNVLESAHPVPDDSSLQAGAALLDFVQNVPESGQLLVLISGGASALVEHLVQGLSLADLQQLTDELLAGGLPIDAMNRVRKTVSTIKGGKLAAFLPVLPVTQLVISDVPGDKLGDIGSGLLAPPVEEPQSAAAGRGLSLPLPSAIEQIVASSKVRAPGSNDAVWQRIQSHIVASSAIAQSAVAAACTEPVIQSSGSLHGDVNDIADAMVNALLGDTRPGVRIWGGETYLHLPAKPGRGGRNQHLALAVAQRIDGVSGLGVLCCGTDGSDGPTADAGGFVTGDTLARGRAMGLDAADALARADAGSYLQAVDGLVTTGPTGTNVMDLAIALRV